MTDESEIEALKHYATKFSHLDGGSLGIPPMTNRVRLSSGKRHGRPRNRTLGIKMNTRKDEPKNMAKYEAYKLAFGQINAALKAGFPIEAIALEESIISDRLESAAVGKGISLKKRPAGRTADFSELAGLVETNAEFRGLAEALEKAGFPSGSLAAWGKSRNDFIHNVAHGAPPRDTGHFSIRV